MERRNFLRLVGSLPAISLYGLHSARAQTAWPSRQMTIVVGLAPGGQADIAARPVALGLSKALGQSVIVDNRTGASGAIAAASVLRSDADAHTMLMALSAAMVLPEAERVAGRKPLYEMSDFAAVARILADPNLLAVSATSPYNSIKDLVDDAKNRPGQIPYSSSGNFGGIHISMEMFCQSAGIRLQHVPYRGGAPALTGLMSGDVALTALGAAPLKGYSDAGKLRVLATFGSERHPAFPDAPTFREAGFQDVVFYAWAGLFVPKSVPEPLMTQLRQAVRDVMTDRETLDIFTKSGTPPAYLDAPEFAAYIAEDSVRLAKTVQKIGKLE